MSKRRLGSLGRHRSYRFRRSSDHPLKSFESNQMLSEAVAVKCAAPARVAIPGAITSARAESIAISESTPDTIAVYATTVEATIPVKVVRKTGAGARTN